MCMGPQHTKYIIIFRNCFGDISKFISPFPSIFFLRTFADQKINLSWPNILKWFLNRSNCDTDIYQVMAGCTMKSQSVWFIYLCACIWNYWHTMVLHYTSGHGHLYSNKWHFYQVWQPRVILSCRISILLQSATTCTSSRLWRFQVFLDSLQKLSLLPNWWNFHLTILNRWLFWTVKLHCW